MYTKRRDKTTVQPQCQQPKPSPVLFGSAGSLTLISMSEDTSSAALKLIYFVKLTLSIATIPSNAAVTLSWYPLFETPPHLQTNNTTASYSLHTTFLRKVVYVNLLYNGLLVGTLYSKKPGWTPERIP